MSETESFKSVAKSYDNFTWIGRDGVKRAIDRLKAAHEREIRDTAQREYDRGFHAGQHSMDAEHRAIAMRLRALPLDGGSHENLSQIARAVYHADFGWTQGACAALRDKLARLMGGVSDDTCDSQCCGACAAGDGGDSGEQTEVSVGRCEWIRDGTRSDSLIPVLPRDEKQTEVSDGRADTIGASKDVGRNDVRVDDCDGGDSGESEVTDGGTADDSGSDTGCGDGGGDLHLDRLVTYDVLDNERQKAVCELRKMRSCKEDHFEPELFFDGLYDALGCRAETGDDSGDQMCDRLIHLLGGDQPSGIDVLRAMDEREAKGRITDELREWMSTVLTSDDHAWSIADRIDEQFGRICQQQEAVLQETIDGMIDERKRTFEAIDARAVKLAEQRNEARRVLIDRNAEYFKLLDEYGEMLDEYAKMEGERDNLLDLLRDARDEYVELQAKMDEHRGTVHLDALSDANLGETVARLRIEKLVKQRDAARARTDELSDELLRTRRERDEARDECDRLKSDIINEYVPRTSYEEKVEKYRRSYMESDAWRKSLQEKLNAMRDAITAALNG